ncbi:MAG TPA: hypothetical protein VKI00_06605 [Mycobacterium sp.]|uniref:hypothetical protein n=1 Tax=Mycobacterium sp. TaxID=1785 RepID=UPI002C88DD4B|nr:hypothetical protein [Mycobacterium sp.]HME75331.1 hypothetical protein [Mycobacterium sp.]
MTPERQLMGDDLTGEDLFDPAIRGSIRVLVESEVAGTAAAAFAERHARNAQEREIWAALRELEEQTRIAVYDQLGGAAARFATTERLASMVGPASGAAVTVLPHRLQMRSLVIATKPFMRHFRKLDAHFANSSRAAFFSYVLAHEVAIAELGRRVLAHDGNPLAPVEALLGNVPT